MENQRKKILIVDVCWFMNGANYVSSTYFVQGQIPGLANWNLITASNVNRDGQPDLIWQMAK